MLGRQLLMTRRLCEAGAGFVTVVNANWDCHARKGIPNILEGMGVFAPPLDRAVSAFLEDLRQRGLEDKIHLVITGEFGRSPYAQNGNGRDHFAKGFTYWLAGGGSKAGTMYGETDEIGQNIVKDPVHVHDLHATLLHLLGLDPESLTYRYGGRDQRLADVSGKVVKGVLA